MKIDRLIGIITVLQQNKKVTAPYLAKEFEVSRRTINRDIEDICRAGIPIVTMQGADGGISIMDGFNLDTTVFTTEKLHEIFIGLKSLDSVSKSSKVTELVKKYEVLKDGAEGELIMLTQQNITALRMERQHLNKPANEVEYKALYRDTSPGQNVYWNGFGDPPSITFRADFNDIEYNRERQRTRELVKGRFQGGNLGWIESGDMELYVCLCRKPLDKPTIAQQTLLDLIEREGPMNIQLMKEMTGMLVKEITPVLHRLQEAFLIYEDQYDGEWDRGWYRFSEMFPSVDFQKYSKIEALKIILKRFAYRNVLFNIDMAKSFYKLPAKDIKTAIADVFCKYFLEKVASNFSIVLQLHFPHCCKHLQM